MIDDATASLKALPDRTEQHMLDGIEELPQGEHIQTWSEELQSVVERLRQRKKKQMPFLDLIYILKLFRPQASLIDCFTEMWIAFMLGSHSYALIRRSSDLYSAIGIKVASKSVIEC